MAPGLPAPPVSADRHRQRVEQLLLGHIRVERSERDAPEPAHQQNPGIRNRLVFPPTRSHNFHTG